jgi:hypothetical protein
MVQVRILAAERQVAAIPLCRAGEPYSVVVDVPPDGLWSPGDGSATLAP